MDHQELYQRRLHCSEPKCLTPADSRYSLGIYAGRYCDQHWQESGYRKDGPEGFDPLDAGESYEED